jgi:hypothetical protein
MIMPKAAYCGSCPRGGGGGVRAGTGVGTGKTPVTVGVEGGAYWFFVSLGFTEHE